MTCKACDNTGWVCETHADRPGECSVSPRSCKCGGACMPCLICNQPDEGERPRAPPGFSVRADADEKEAVH
jgi:hypothetical protein